MKKKLTKILACSLVMIAFASFSLGSSGSNNGAKKVGTVDETTTESQKDDVKETKKPKETEPALKDEYKVGDVLEVSGLRITYISSGEYISDNQFLQPADGNKYIFAKFYVENISNSDEGITYYDFEGFADGYSVKAFYGLDDGLSATLSAGRSTTGTISFEVPEDATEIEIEYEYDMFNDKRVKFIYEGELDSNFVPVANTEATPDAFNVGDIIETKNLKITYVSCGEYISDNQFIQPLDGYRFVEFELEFENISDSDQSVSSYSFDCFADGASCNQKFNLDDSLDSTLSSGRKCSGYVRFEVPCDATVIELEYETNLFTSNRIVFAYSE